MWSRFGGHPRPHLVLVKLREEKQRERKGEVSPTNLLGKKEESERKESVCAILLPVDT